MYQTPTGTPGEHEWQYHVCVLEIHSNQPVSSQTVATRKSQIRLICKKLVSFYVYSERRRVFTGRWSEDGCDTVFNSTSTVCKCNHLTHFAILLSARPLQLPQPQVLALQVTGYVGVSVSLVAMAAVIFVFLFLK